MRVVLQRVKKASVSVDKLVVGDINEGILVLLGIEISDTDEDALWLSKKIVSLRIFGDADGLMNLSLRDIDGSILVVSQFTLHASTKKGNRPSFTKAARPEQAIPLYNYFKDQLKKNGVENIQEGIFGAMMEVSLINDGPVTITMDSKNRE